MPINQSPFDCSLTLRSWRHDPEQSVAANMLSLIKCYSRDFKRMILEIHRLEDEVADLRSARRAEHPVSEFAEIQRFIDASIADLDQN